MKIVCLSDTHNKHKKIEVPDGDILLHSGDFTARGNEREVRDFNRWMATLPHKHKIVISGNHDWFFEKMPRSYVDSVCTNFTYLQDEFVEVEGLKIYGSPWQPWFYNWAFNLQRGKEILAKWKKIPEDVDILLTHGPAFEILDSSPGVCGNVGCEDLLDEIKNRIKPKIHLCGHIHGGHGVERHGETVFVNASICTERYEPHQLPIVIDIKEDGEVVFNK